MKGIILAGGLGTRLYPATSVISKQLLPIYDKPMVYYPLSVLLLAGIHNILLISTPKDIKRFKELLGNGRQWGIHITYAVQDEPRGLADAFIVAKDFIGKEPVAMILGDNIFYGNGLSHLLQQAAKKNVGATVFAYRVKRPERYGIVTFDNQGKALEIVEKPKKPASPYAVTGLYFYDNDVVEIASTLTPSERGELEITDVNNHYLKRGRLDVVTLSRGMAWLDTGTFSSLNAASQFIEAVETRQDIKIACIEEVAYRMGYINKKALQKLIDQMPANDYQNYLKGVIHC